MWFRRCMPEILQFVFHNQVLMPSLVRFQELIFRSSKDVSTQSRLQLITIGAKNITDRNNFLGNSLEIGNALPCRKNCFQELFGPVIVIKSVMESLAGKVLFLFVSEKPGKAPPLSVQLHSRDKISGIIPVNNRSSELNR